MNFKKSLKYLYSLGNEVLAMKLGLKATEKLLAALGNPEKTYLKIQIAGTNGKGSTCAFLDAICRSAKIKTGLFTSPHLISITERIKINGAQISETDFARHATGVRRISEKLVEQNILETVPTFFEQLTAIAVCAFADAGIELAILETGLGGRFDSVTAARAEIAAITQIDYDHQQILGNSLAEIAAEKAAIIRRDTKVVVAAEQNAEAMKVILDKCEAVNVEPHLTTFKTELRAADVNSGRLSAVFREDEIRYETRLGLSGRHQLSNAQVAIKSAELLSRDFGFAIGKASIEKGLENARHKGRLEFFHKILFDGAHNAAGAKALRKFLDEFAHQPITMIFGAMRDKDLSEIAGVLFPKAQILILTEPDNPRSAETAEIMRIVPKLMSGKIVHQTASVAEALKIAETECPAENLICVTGSLYLVGEVQQLLNLKFDL